MSACAALNKELDLSCSSQKKKYVQRVVIMNRKDIKQSFFRSDFVYNRVTFNLKEGKQGYVVSTSDIANIITGTFSKSDQGGVPVYTHRIKFPIVGADEFIKVMLKQLDASDLFAALQFTDGSVEIYGFNFGLKSVPYEYGPGSNLGGSIITMESAVPEYEPPLIYFPSTLSGDELTTENQEIIDANFDNKFLGISDFLCGDFSIDFNNDFNNSCEAGSTSS